jgi:hypothetical protein
MITNRAVPSIRHFSRLALVLALGLTAIASAKAEEGTYAQRIACTPDAFRLCSGEIPDADAVRTCMIANKTKLSAACRATFPKELVSR